MLIHMLGSASVLMVQQANGKLTNKVADSVVLH